ncbi:hypothetical protein [Microlunatus ginsengisoli]|uniref:Uncharacterized protein n=1 Tax=Microlunatus ginsengisoli TaxID=363863 RepID=A0ABP6ZRG6_9ACTN
MNFTWRVYLVGEDPDLSLLRRELAAGDVLLLTGEQGSYLQAADFEAYTDAADVLTAAQNLITLLNGMLSRRSYRPVRSAGRIERGGSTWVYVSDTVRVTAAISADGVVTDAEGAVAPSGPSQLARQLRAALDHPVVAEAHRILGLTASPSWHEFYKVYEILQVACGGGDYELSRCTGVSQRRIEKLTATCNHQVLSGDEARHAAMKGTPSTSRRITKDEGRAIINELIEGYVSAQQ